MNSQHPAANQDLELLIGAGADPTALAAFLDGLDDAGRVREVRSLSRKALVRCTIAVRARRRFSLPTLFHRRCLSGKTF